MDSKISDKPQPSEKPTNILPDKWNYQTFKEYLLALSRGSEFRIPLEQMPQEIDLSADWHLVLDRMRDGTTSDGVERWIGIGYKDDRTGLWLRNAPLMGRGGSVPSELIDHGLGRMKYYGKMTGVLGDIHSHPRISLLDQS